MDHSYASNLSALLADICHVPAVLDTAITGLCIDSRLVQKGDLFLAVSGIKSVSTDHILEAVRRGANAIVAEGTLYNGQVFEDGRAVELFVDDLKQKAGQIADRFYKYPSRDLSVIGVTGTNGKTSVSSYIAHFLSLGGMQTGIIGTLGYGLVKGQKTSFHKTDHTTPNVVEVHRYLARLRDQGAKCVVMEVSSHGLSQSRVEGVRFEGAVFTNLTRDHLDYHGSMSAYGECKRKLFENKSLKFAILNNDDAFAQTIKASLSDAVFVYTFGMSSNADISVASFTLHNHEKLGIEAKISTPIGALSIHSSLVGAFNLSNLLAVVAVSIAKNDTAECEKRISALKTVEGRMEVFQHKNSPVIVIDYAHTPDALKNVLESLQGHTKGKLYLIFGCGGERDKGKRAEMAKVAELFADNIVVTDDNPRFENPKTIIQEILQGFSNLDLVEVISERSKAISTVLHNATDKDLVLIAGKGHETWQEVEGERRFFSDALEVKRFLGIQEESCSHKEVAHD